MPALPIECRVTPWFYKRMAMMGGMFLLFAGWFYKDGKWSWPEENERAAKQEWFQKDVLGGYDEAKKAGTLEAWIAKARADGFPLKDSGEPEKWVSHAAKQGWPEKPKRRTQTEIEAQFNWAGGMGMAALLVLGHVLMTRRKKLIGEVDHFITPEGKRVNYADAYKIDKRPWDQKGFAYVYHRPGGNAGTGSGSKAVLDDLKYDGTHQVLELLMSQFKGELIEKVEVVVDADEGQVEKTEGPN